MKSLPLAVGLPVLCALFALTWLARPIQDPDFFWHLKMGEWLWQNHSWPIPDPFAFTTPANFEQWQIFIVKGYWLSQILYYFCYIVSGWWGIFWLRLVIFSIFLLVLWKYRQGDLWFWCGCSLICLATIFDAYPLERPQFLSFICFAWLYLLLDKIWSAQVKISWHHVWAVGIVMFAWGNLHRGFILGQGLLLLSLVINLLWHFFPGTERRTGDVRLWGLLTAGLLAGFLNPNALRYIPALLQAVADTTAMGKGSAALMTSSNYEYYSMWQIWQGKGWAIVLPYALVLLLSLAVLPFSFRKQPLFSLLILAGTAVYATMHVRYLAFFMLGAVPILMRGGACMPWQRMARWSLVACSVLILAYLAYDERGNVAAVRKGGWVSNQDFPVEVANVLSASDIKGRLFNTYGWGGYLLWRLGPGRQVFIDGRNFNEQIARDAFASEMVDLGGGRMIWKEVFDKYRISHAVLPIVSGGAPYALTHAIARDLQWQIACTSGNAALLVRREQP